MSGAIVHSIQSEDEGVTRSLRLRFYLRELERQAEICNEGIADALRCASVEERQRQAWRHLQGAMFAAIVVYRLLTGGSAAGRGWKWLPTKERRAAAQASSSLRAKALRELIQLPTIESTALAQVRGIRDSLEHVDERIDERIAAPGVLSLADWYVTDDFLMASEDGQGTGLRALHANMGFLYFNLDALDLFELDIFMLTVRTNARDAIAQLQAADPKGVQNHFGGQAWELTSNHQRWLDWQTRRDQLMKDLQTDSDLP